ncbi:hypothetical protein [Hydrogenovibrio marinus]|uniref:hypothetical protein n=1 Tax=Hydrogenovibrio marinus TaxID=28885 RepID=UPI0004A6C5F1|nr:hypothetical protein [Hydrogenovibrio marinus]
MKRILITLLFVFPLSPVFADNSMAKTQEEYVHNLEKQFIEHGHILSMADYEKVKRDIVELPHSFKYDALYFLWILFLVAAVFVMVKDFYKETSFGAAPVILALIALAFYAGKVYVSPEFQLMKMTFSDIEDADEKTKCLFQLPSIERRQNGEIIFFEYSNACNRLAVVRGKE